MSDVVVVDASLAIKWVLAEPDSATAIMLLNKWTNEGTKIIAPALFAYEVTNIIYRRVVAKLLTYDEAMSALTDLFSIGVSLRFSRYQDVSITAMRLAQHFDQPASYDSHYLALAQQKNCKYWTSDTRLWNAVKGKLDWVHTLGDYQP
jgi:predicted nucleic acid-binding protein